MRVLFVNPAAGLGGSERSLLDAHASLRKAEPSLEANLLLLESGPLESVAREQGFRVEVEPLPAVLSRLGEAPGSPWGAVSAAIPAVAALPRLLRRLRRHAREVAPTLIHTNGMKAHWLGATALRDWPLVVHVRDFLSSRAIGRRLLSVLSPRAIVVANSRAVAEDISGLSSRVVVRVVYNGVDTSTFSPGPGDLARLTELAGLPPPGRWTISVGMAATYAHWKGHRLFLEAARRVRDAEPTFDFRFLVVGGPIYQTPGSQLTEAELRTWIRELGLERDAGLVPFQRDIPAIYRALDVAVHASTRPEPFGRTIVEAMACERSVVVARAGGAAELFDEGRTALGFTPGSADDLARAILELVRNPELRRRLSSNARADAVNRFDRARLGPELLNVYAELLRGRP